MAKKTFLTKYICFVYKWKFFEPNIKRLIFEHPCFFNNDTQISLNFQIFLNKLFFYIVPESLESIMACVQQSDPISSWSAAEPQKPNWAGIWEESMKGWTFFWRNITNSSHSLTRNFERSPRLFVPYILFQYKVVLFWHFWPPI